jgi:hypothetical protein
MLRFWLCAAVLALSTVLAYAKPECSPRAMERLEEASTLLMSAKNTTQYRDTAAAIHEAREARSIGASLSDACKGVNDLDLQCGKFLAEQYIYARDFEAAIAASKGKKLST